MTKLSDSYRTPKELFDTLDSVTSFFWDGCCTKENCLVEWQKALLNQDDELWLDYINYPYNYLSFDVYKFTQGIHHEGIYCMSQDSTIFINPPYSRGSVGPIIEKAWEDAKHFRVVMLLKADMSTDWFNQLFEKLGAGYPVQRLQIDCELKQAYRFL